MNRKALISQALQALEALQGHLRAQASALADERSRMIGLGAGFKRSALRRTEQMLLEAADELGCIARDLQNGDSGAGTALRTAAQMVPGLLMLVKTVVGGPLVSIDASESVSVTVEQHVARSELKCTELQGLSLEIIDGYGPQSPTTDTPPTDPESVRGRAMLLATELRSLLADDEVMHSDVHLVSKLVSQMRDIRWTSTPRARLDQITKALGRLDAKMRAPRAGDDPLVEIDPRPLPSDDPEVERLRRATDGWADLLLSDTIE